MTSGADAHSAVVVVVHDYLQQKLAAETDVQKYLQQQFAKHDFAKLGRVDRQYLWLVVKKLPLGLSDTQVEQLRDRLDPAQDGSQNSDSGGDVDGTSGSTCEGGSAADEVDDDVTWEEFAQLPQLLCDIYTEEMTESDIAERDEEADWVELPVRLRRRFEGRKRRTLYYNRCTGRSQWTAPDFEDRNEAPPAISEYLRGRFSEFDNDGQGSIATGRLPDLMQLLTAASGSELALTQAEAKVLELKLLEKSETQAEEEKSSTGGIILVSEAMFCEEVPRELENMVERLAEMEPELLKVQGISAQELTASAAWCELPTQEMWRKYWYNKRTGQAQWVEPQEAVDDDGTQEGKLPTIGAFFDTRREEFGKAHTDLVEMKSFAAMLDGLHFNLSQDLVNHLYERIMLREHPHEHGHSRPPTWRGLVDYIGDELTAIFADEDECFENDLVKLTQQQELPNGETIEASFWFSKRTGATSRQSPPSLQAYVEERIRAALAQELSKTRKKQDPSRPTISVAARTRCSRRMFIDVLATLDLALSPSECERIEQELSNQEDDDGELSFVDAAAEMGAWIAEVCREDPMTLDANYWYELHYGLDNTDSAGNVSADTTNATTQRSFWYNKRDEVSRSKRPLGLSSAVPTRNGETLLRVYLVREFKKFDPAQNGSLKSQLFRTCINESRLDLHDEQVAQLEEKLLHPSGEVRWKEFIEHAEEILREVQSEVDVQHSDWCRIPSETHRQNFWYNKRNGTAQWPAPPRIEEYLMARLEDEEQRTDPEYAGEQSEYVSVPVVAGALRQQDLTTPGELSGVVTGLASGDGHVHVDDFLERTPTLLAEHCESMGENAWLELDYEFDDGLAESFWYNKRAGFAQWEPPPDFRKHMKFSYEQMGGMDADGGVAAASFFELNTNILGLSEGTIDQMKTMMEQPLDGAEVPLLRHDRVFWEDFLPDAMQVIARACNEAEDDIDADPEGTGLGGWVQMKVMRSVNEEPFWYNKRTGDLSWKEPLDVISAKALKVAKSKLPTLTELLRYLFDREDHSGSGKLKTDLFFPFIRDMFVLSDEQMTMLHKLVKTSGSFIQWAPFAADAMEILRRIYRLEEDDSDLNWCALRTKYDCTFWYDKRHGILQWHKPPVIVEKEEEMIERPPPTVKETIATWLKPLDRDGSGTIPRQEMWAALKQFELYLSDKDVHFLQKSPDFKGDRISWSVFAKLARSHIRACYTEKEDKHGDICELHVPGSKTKTFMFNKRTSRTHWSPKMPSLKAYFVAAFRRIDTEATGFCTITDFENIMGRSDLQLTPEDVNYLKGCADVEGSSVNWRKFIRGCSDHLMQLYSEEAFGAPRPFFDNWCRVLPIGDGNDAYWYNKRTAEYRWTKPQETQRLIPMLEEALIGQVLAIQQHHYQRGQASDPVDNDFDRPVTFNEPDMSLSVKWDTIAKLSLGLTPAQIISLRAAIERNVGHGKAPVESSATAVEGLSDAQCDGLQREEEPRTSWGDFMLHVEDALSSVYAGQSSTFEEEWCSVRVDACDDHFWYNKRSGESQWHQPHISQWLAPGMKMSDRMRLTVQRIYENDPKLTILNSRMDPFGRDGVELLCKLLRRNRQLTMMNLAANSIGDDGVDKMAKVLPSTINSLDLWHNEITDLGAMALGKHLLKNTTLTHLSLRDNSIGPAGVQELMEALARGSLLSHLSLARNVLGNRGCNIVAGTLQHKQFWYNQRTRKVQWQTPRLVMEEQERVPMFEEFLLHNLCKDSHGGGTETVSARELRMSELKFQLSRLGLRLSPVQVNEICNQVPVVTSSVIQPSLADSADGRATEVINLDTFVRLAPSLIMQSMKSVEQSFDADWCELSTDWCDLASKRGTSYWMNKRTCEAQWLRPPNVNVFLSAQFDRYEVGGSGAISSSVLMKLLKDSKLDLTYKQIANLSSKLADSRGTVSKDVFVRQVPGTLRKLMGREGLILGSDWCALEEGGRPYWYNKRTEQALWIKPRVRVEYEEEPPQLKDYLRSIFKSFDTDALGKMDSDQYRSMAGSVGKTMKLEHTQVEIMLSDVDDTKEYSCLRFVEAPQQKDSFLYQLRKIFSAASGARDPTHEWCPLADQHKSQGRIFWFNKRTFETTWDKPLALIEAEAAARRTDDADEALPSLTKLLRDQLDEISASGDDDVTEGELWDIVDRTLLLSQQDPILLDTLRKQSEVVVEGQVLPDDFIHNIKANVQRTFVTEQAAVPISASDWRHIPGGNTNISDTGSKFWYNARTGASQWRKPDAVTDAERAKMEAKILPEFHEYMQAALASQLRPTEAGLLVPDVLWRAMRKLPLDLPEHIVQHMRTRCPVDGDGRVVLASFIHDAESLMQGAYAVSEPVTLHDWCKLEHGTKIFWFNKRTGMSQWPAPPDTARYFQSLVVDALRTEAEKKAQEESLADADVENDGVDGAAVDTHAASQQARVPKPMRWHDMADMLDGSELRLSQAERESVLVSFSSAAIAHQLHTRARKASLSLHSGGGVSAVNDGSLMSNDVALKLGLWLKKASATVGTGWEWCQLYGTAQETSCEPCQEYQDVAHESETNQDHGTEGVSQRAQPFWYNKRTGYAQWEKPPNVYARCRERYEEHEVDEADGLIPGKEFFEITSKLFQLSENHTEMLKSHPRLRIEQEADSDNSVKWSKSFVARLGHVMRELYIEEDADENMDSDWCEIRPKALPAGMQEERSAEELRSIWFNKRTSEAQWSRPPTIEGVFDRAFAHILSSDNDDTVAGDGANVGNILQFTAVDFWKTVQDTFELSDVHVFQLQQPSSAGPGQVHDSTRFDAQQYRTLDNILATCSPEDWARILADDARPFVTKLHATYQDMRASTPHRSVRMPVTAEWCGLQDKDAGSFAFNKCSGQKRRHRPVEAVNASIPNVVDCMLKCLKRDLPQTRPGRREHVSRAQFWHAVRSISFDLSESQFARLCERLQSPELRSSTGSWAQLVHNVIDCSSELQAERKPSPCDWSQLPLAVTLRSLDLSSNGIGPRGAEELGRALLTNEVLTDLDLSCNAIGCRGAKAMALMLRSNAVLRSLNLWANNLRADGTAAIADALTCNSTLRVMCLRENDAGRCIDIRESSVGAEDRLANMIVSNSALHELDLWGNGVTDEGARLIFAQLALNSTLQKLNLRFNALGDASMHQLFVALKDANSALRELDLWGNQIGDEGAKQIAEALKENACLEQVNLRENRVGDPGAQALAMALQHHNKTLVTLNLRGNHVSSLAADMLLAATATQRRIEIIDLRDNPRAASSGLLVRSLAV